MATGTSARVAAMGARRWRFPPRPVTAGRAGWTLVAGGPRCRLFKLATLAWIRQHRGAGFREGEQPAPRGPASVGFDARDGEPDRTVVRERCHQGGHPAVHVGPDEGVSGDARDVYSLVGWVVAGNAGELFVVTPC